MRRQFVLVLGFGLLLSHARADDIPAETVTAVKRAAVFVRVQGPTWKGSGSGFVVVAEKDTVLIATNYHVIAVPGAEKKTNQPPAELVKSFKVPTVTAVFDAGTKTELSAKAEIIAADPESDLAIIRVTGLKAPPAPVAYANPTPPTETMAVFTFGYPFGDALASGKSAPAITVGKGTVSSLRNDDDGELKMVQIDASLNPGNSGGPIVDAKGRLVGIVVSGIRNSQGVNFAIPAAQLDKLMKGRLDGFQVTATRTPDGKLTLRAEVGVIDPTAAVRSVTLHYLIVPPKGAKPKPGEALEKQTGTKKVALKIEAGVATGEITLDVKDAPAGEILIQAVPDGPGASGTSRVRGFALVVPKTETERIVLGGPGSVATGPGAGEAAAPSGWKEYSAFNKTFALWIPEKASTREAQRTSGKGAGPRMTFNVVAASVPNGPTYVVEQITTPPNLKADRDELMGILRDAALGDAPGAKIARESDTAMGPVPGKEYLVERGTGAVRARAFVVGNNLYLLRAVGTREQVDSEASTTFLDSCRLQVGPRPPAPSTAPGAGAVIAGGGPQDPEFKDPAPEKGVLVGMEFALDKVGPNTVVKGVRGVFRAGDKETFGPWRGAPGPDNEKDAAKVVAKPGYAVGAITVRTGPAVYGLSVTFVKVVDGKLDPKDKYESDWIGGKDGPAGAMQTTVGGKADVARGLVGKTNDRGLSGVGLLYQDIEKKEPNPVPNPGKAADRGPRIQGGGEREYRDAAPPNGVLVGLEVSLAKFFNNDVVKAVRPIYRVGEKESVGEQLGTQLTNVVKAVAKPGYAVGAISLRTGGGIDGLSITFMKVADGKLDPKDSYESDWIGGMGGGAPVRVGGDGSLVVGLLGRGTDKEMNGLGLIYSDTNKPQLDGVFPPGVPSRILCGGGDPEFRDAGPEGSLLVGFEVGLGKAPGGPVLKSVRPVFRAGEKDSVGEWHGPTGDDVVKEVVKVIAKPGYAVGRITVKTGLWPNGFSVTFMRVVNGQLDPTDVYESDWIANNSGGATKIGNGKPIIGLIGKTRPDSISGLGLLFPPAK